MITGLLLPLTNMAREASLAARASLRTSAWLAAAALTGAVGAGFVIFSAYQGLRLVLGPELAALVMGIVLCGLAAALVAVSRRTAPRPPPAWRVVPSPPHTAARHPADPATMAVFTAAFVLGRYLSDRRRG